MDEVYSRVPETARDNLDDSLLAYYAGMELVNTHPTLATVTVIAALGSLYTVPKCDGSLACTKCNALPWKHNLLGDRSTLTNVLSELFGIAVDDPERKNLAELLERIYSKHRSAFVHSAIMRHGEMGEGQMDSIAIPTETSHVPNLYEYFHDLQAFMKVARRGILEHLARLAGGATIDYETFSLSREVGPVRRSFQGSFTVGPRMVKLDFSSPNAANEAGRRE